jgi:hypothetical protein
MPASRAAAQTALARPRRGEYFAPTRNANPSLLQTTPDFIEAGAEVEGMPDTSRKRVYSSHPWRCTGVLL